MHVLEKLFSECRFSYSHERWIQDFLEEGCPPVFSKKHLCEHFFLKKWVHRKLLGTPSGHNTTPSLWLKFSQNAYDWHHYVVFSFFLSIHVFICYFILKEITKQWLYWVHLTTSKKATTPSKRVLVHFFNIADEEFSANIASPCGWVFVFNQTHHKGNQWEFF